MAMPPEQLWLGSIPGDFDEAQCLADLRAYGIIPKNLILHRRDEGDSWAICYFASEALASAAAEKMLHGLLASR